MTPSRFRTFIGILLAVLGLILLIIFLGGAKYLQFKKMTGKPFVMPPQPVTTAEATSDAWETRLEAVGSLSAVQGVMVAPELDGKVVHIAFQPGAVVKAGDLLVQQDISSETAQLRAAEAKVTLARLNFERSRKLIDRKIIPQSKFDDDAAQFKQAAAEADTIRATIRKKSIRAPFAGRLGIRLINMGQILEAGQAIVSLQSIHPIFVDFRLPQQQLPRVRIGLTVRITTDGLPGQGVEGQITAINPDVDTATRNIRIQATVPNDQERLRPGMYVNVAVILSNKKKVLVIPATAVLYAPYSDSVFVVEEKKNEQSGRMEKAVRQQIVRMGEKRGDFVAVVSGLKPGDTVVSTGVFKLRNGQSVVVNNDLAPEFKLSPRPGDS